MKIGYKLLLVVFFLCASSRVFGQDLITRSDGVVIKATAVEIQPHLVSFRLFAPATDTLVYQISLQDVQSIQLADGSMKYQAEAASATKAPFNFETSSGRNILWFYPVDLFYANIILAYERIFASGKLGVKLPLIIGLNPNPNEFYTNVWRTSRFGLGLELNFYPFGQGRFQYFVTPAFQVRSFWRKYYTDQPEIRKKAAIMGELALKNGIYYQFTRHFMISADVGIGYRFFSKQQPSDRLIYYMDRPQSFVPANIHLGFRF